MNTRASEFLARATDPNQYDNPELDWGSEGDADSPVRRFLWQALEPQIGDLTGQQVLDIGCGNGWLADRLYEAGAARVWGLEPSARNRQTAIANHPELVVVPTTLIDYETDHPFDTVTAIMVFEHLPDLEAAFAKIKSLSKPGGRFLTIVGDKDTFLTPRPDYKIEAQELDDGEFVIQALRDYGLLYDIVRPVGNFQRAAEASGFELEAAVPLVPTAELREQVSRYGERGDDPICHLLVFNHRNQV